MGDALVEVLRMGAGGSPERADRHRPPGRSRRADPGDPPRLLDPKVPTVAVTGDNSGRRPRPGPLGRMAAEAGLLARVEQHRRGVRGRPVHRGGGLVRPRWRPYGARGAGGGDSPCWRPPAAA